MLGWVGVMRGMVGEAMGGEKKEWGGAGKWFGAQIFPLASHKSLASLLVLRCIPDGDPFIVFACKASLRGGL